MSSCASRGHRPSARRSTSRPTSMALAGVSGRCALCLVRTTQSSPHGDRASPAADPESPCKSLVPSACYADKASWRHLGKRRIRRVHRASRLRSAVAGGASQGARGAVMRRHNARPSAAGRVTGCSARRQAAAALRLARAVLSPERRSRRASIPPQGAPQGAEAGARFE